MVTTEREMNPDRKFIEDVQRALEVWQRAQGAVHKQTTSEQVRTVENIRQFESRQERRQPASETSKIKAKPCSRCGEPIIWVQTDRGKRLALDEVPVPREQTDRDGGYVLTGGLIPNDWGWLTPEATWSREDEVLVPHFTSCSEMDTA